MKKEVNANLRITNVVVSGRLPLKKKLNFTAIINKSKLLWEINNEEICPILSVRFQRNGERLNVHKKKKTIYLSIWNAGGINIVGVLSLDEAKKYYNIVIEELLRIEEIKLSGGSTLS